MRRGSIAARATLAETSIPEGPRRELRAGTTGVDLELGGVAIRAGDLPLLRRTPAGLSQCVRLAIAAPEPRGRARLSLFAAGRRVDTAELDLDGGTTTVRLFAPAVERPTPVLLESELEGGPRRSDELELQPQRRWRVHLVHHSHFDLGYTDPQGAVMRHHLAYLDSALDLAAAHDGFRWTVESNLPLERWLAARPRAAREEMLDHLRSGRFEACALPFTLHAEAASIDELARLLRFATELRREGVEVVSAMQTDVPGAPPGLPLVLADAGVRYLSVAHNWASRAAPALTGGDRLPRAFHWATASGQRVLVWHTDSPHGIAYLEGNLLGLADSYDDAVELVPEYLAALALRGYPYAGPHATLGLPEAGVREPYPFDVLHLRVQGLLADNAGPSLAPAEIAAAWAAEFAYPELVPSTNRDFFDELGAQNLESFGGDWADWWADGLGSAAREVGFNRRAQAAVRTAQTLHVLADAIAGVEPVRAAELDAVYERTALFDEHTWCAAHPDGNTLSGRESGALQWQAKAALAVEARARADALLDAAASRFRTRRDESILVLNPSGHKRSDLVEVFVPGARAVAVVDVERGERVASALGPPEPSRNRPQGRMLSFVARDVPGLGYRRFELVEDGVQHAPSNAGPFENEHYRVELDVEGGHAVGVVDRERGRDLVDAASPFGFAQVVRDLYGGVLQATRRASGSPVTHADGRASDALVTARSVPADGVLERSANAVEERAVIRTRAAGFDLVETTFKLVRGIRRLDVSVRLVKHATSEKESVNVVFPFAATGARISYELTGGVGGGPCVPGSAAHMHAIRHWAVLEAPDATLAWATLQAPLVQFGNIFLPYPPYPETIDAAGDGFVTSWVANNVWETNFPLAQSGELRFDYAIASAGPGADGRVLGIATADTLTRPFVGVIGATASDFFGSVCEIEAPGVEVVMLAPSDRGGVLHLQSYADDEVAVHLAGRELRIAPGDYVVVPIDL